MILFPAFSSMGSRPHLGRWLFWQGRERVLESRGRMGSRAVLNDNVPHICSHLARVQRTQIENGNPGTASFLFCFTLSWKVKEIWKRRRRKHETNSQKKMKVDKRDRSVKECYLEEFGIAVCVICKRELLYREFSARRLKWEKTNKMQLLLLLFQISIGVCAKKYTFKYPPVRCILTHL